MGVECNLMIAGRDIDIYTNIDSGGEDMETRG